MHVPDDRRYSSEHEWVRVEDGRARIGITDYAQQELGDVVFLELPAVGATLTRGQVFGTAESVKAVSELFAPVSGRVAEVNQELVTHPELVNTQPYEAWMIAVELDDESQGETLLEASAYTALIG